jgi:hypothetical protein
MELTDRVFPYSGMREVTVPIVMSNMHQLAAMNLLPKEAAHPDMPSFPIILQVNLKMFATIVIGERVHCNHLSVT